MSVLPTLFFTTRELNALSGKYKSTCSLFWKLKFKNEKLKKRSSPILIFNSLLCSSIDTSSSLVLRLNVEETDPFQCISISFEVDGITLILPNSPSTTICSRESADRRISSPTSFLSKNIFPINTIPITPIAISKIATVLKHPPFHPQNIPLIHDKIYTVHKKLF